MVCTTVDCQTPATCSPEECGPAPDEPNRACSDGTSMAGVGPCQRLENGECGYPPLMCPQQMCGAAVCTADQSCIDGDCVEETDRCRPGEAFDAGDGCNACECPASGRRSEASCTEMACAAGCVNSEECASDEYCNFDDDLCGIVASRGTCQARPADCAEPGGVPTCGCGGVFGLSACEVGLRGADISRVGGCSKPDAPNRFLCLDTDCDRRTESCIVTREERGNGVVGGQCATLPDGCLPGVCPCDDPSVEMANCFSFDGVSVFVLPAD